MAVWNGSEQTVHTIRTNDELRRHLQWELLESGHRFDILQLDKALLPELAGKDARMQQIYRLWGENGTHEPRDVLFPTHLSQHAKMWCSPLDKRDILARWISVASAWPTCTLQFPKPEKFGDLSQGEVNVLLRRLVRFYVGEFVNVFGRLPFPPPSSVPSLSKG